jgi:hypothetical protein
MSVLHSNLTVLGIRDIVVSPKSDLDPRICTSDLRIRMRIREAQKHTDTTDPDPRMRVQTTGTFTSFFKDKKSKRSNKINVFLLFLLDDGRIWSRIGNCD